MEFRVLFSVKCRGNLSNELDHSYNLSSENQDPVYNVSRQEDIVSDCTSDVELEWRTGRRVVELGTLANGLKACQLCSQPLHLINTVGERRFGLAQILEVKCMYSVHVFRMWTCK